MNTRITIPVGDSGVKRKHFEGTPWNSLVAMSYINNKFRNNCVIIPYRNEPNDHTDLSIRWVQKKGEDGYLHVPKNFTNASYLFSFSIISLKNFEDKAL